MPVCDGFTSIGLIRSLEKMQAKAVCRENQNRVPVKNSFIVALTGLAAKRDQDAAKAVGADYFLTKPLKLSRLRELWIEWKITPGAA
jgi:CheY-like chemotaxis protein